MMDCWPVLDILFFNSSVQPNNTETTFRIPNQDSKAQGRSLHVYYIFKEATETCKTNEWEKQIRRSYHYWLQAHRDFIIQCNWWRLNISHLITITTAQHEQSLPWWIASHSILSLLGQFYCRTGLHTTQRLRWWPHIWPILTNMSMTHYHNHKHDTLLIKGDATVSWLFTGPCIFTLTAYSLHTLPYIHMHAIESPLITNVHMGVV